MNTQSFSAEGISPRRVAHSRHKRRFWHVCEDCHNRFRSARPDTLYCGNTCRCHAYQMRREKRLQQLVIDSEAARRQAELAQARQKREQAIAQERAEQMQAVENEKARKAAIRERLGICKCGNLPALWSIHLERKGLIGPKEPIQVCQHCSTPASNPVNPGPCPRCGEHNYWLTLSGPDTGALRCRECEQTREWGEWPTGDKH